MEFSREGEHRFSGVEVEFCPVGLSDVLLAGLEDLGFLWDLLSLEEERPCVFTVVGKVNLSDVHCVVSKVIVDDVGVSFAMNVESEHSSVIIKELFPRCNFASSERVFQEVHHLLVFLCFSWNLRLLEVIFRERESLLQLDSHRSVEEVPCVGVSIDDLVLSAIDFNCFANKEICRNEQIFSTWFDHGLSLEENSLWSARVCNFRLVDHQS